MQNAALYLMSYLWFIDKRFSRVKGNFKHFRHTGTFD